MNRLPWDEPGEQLLTLSPAEWRALNAVPGLPGALLNLCEDLHPQALLEVARDLITFAEIVTQP